MDPTDGMKDAGSDGPVDAGVCDDQSIQTYEAVPTVLLLVDTSSSMFDQRAKLWDPLFNALMDPTTGVVAKLNKDKKVHINTVAFVKEEPSYKVQLEELAKDNGGMYHFVPEKDLGR